MVYIPMMLGTVRVSLPRWNEMSVMRSVKVAKQLLILYGPPAVGYIER